MYKNKKYKDIDIKIAIVKIYVGINKNDELLNILNKKVKQVVEVDKLQGINDTVR